MTHTTRSLTRFTPTISRCLIAACTAFAILPVSAQAGVRPNGGVLLPIVHKVHVDLVTFEQLASQRWFPDHEFEYIKIMTQKACRLADAVKCDEHYGRIRADYDVLRVFVRTVDQRLCRHRASQFDHQLMQLWNSIKHDLDGAACLVTNACSVQCGHLAPPVRVPPYAVHGVPQRAPRTPGLPPSATPLPHNFRADNDRPQDAGPNYGRFNEAFRGPSSELRHGGIPAPERRYDTRYRPGDDRQRQSGPAPAWFDLLSAALSR